MEFHSFIHRIGTKKECYDQVEDVVKLANELIRTHKCTGTLALTFPNYKIDLLRVFVDQGRGYNLAYQDAFDPQKPWDVISFAHKAAYIRLFTSFVKKGLYLPEIKNIFKKILNSELSADIWVSPNLSTEAIDILSKLSELFVELFKRDSGQDLYDFLKNKFLSDDIQDIKNVSVIYKHFLEKYLGFGSEQASEIIAGAESRTKSERERFVNRLSSEILILKLNRLKTFLSELKGKLSKLKDKLEALNQKLGG